MIEQLSDNMTSFLVKKDIVFSDEFELYKYGIKHILINMVTVITIIILSIILKSCIISAFFFLGFIPLRKVAGGYHASTSRGCSILSLVIYLSNVLLINMIYLNITVQLYAILVISSVVSIYACAPVDHKNKKLSDKEYVKNKKVSRLLIVLMMFGISLLGIKTGINSSLVLAMTMGAFTASVSVVVGWFIRRGERNE